MVEAAVLHRLLLFFIVLGIGISSFAALEVVDPALQKGCTINPLFSCQAVDESGRTTVGPVPDWSIGLGGFVALLLVDLPLIRSYDERYLKAILGLSLIGVVASVYFTYVEVFEIGAICPVCLSAYLANVGVLAVALLLYRMRQHALETEAGSSDEASAA